MRRHWNWIALLTLPMLTACGNNPQASFNPFPNTSAASQVNPATGFFGTYPNCGSPNIESTDSSFSAAYSSATLCTTAIQGTLVQLSVGTTVPAGTSICLMPFEGSVFGSPICQSLSGGTTTFLLPSNQYTSIVVLPGGNLQSYEYYLATPGAAAPSRMIFTF
jgi:hypothetical protein